MLINLPKEAHHIFHYVHVETVYTMYIYTNLLNLRATCGSAEQPIPSPIGKAPSQPKWQADKTGSKETPDWKTLGAAKALTSWVLT